MSGLLNMIKKHEGFATHPYKDTVGKITIGFGRNIEDMGISESEAEMLLINDIARVSNELYDNFPWFLPLSMVRRDAMIDMTFNLGITRLRGFKKMCAAMNIGHWDVAAKEMLSSKWASQVGQRAITLSEMIRTGKYP